MSDETGRLVAADAPVPDATLAGRRSTVFLSECLVAEPVEGAQMMARRMLHDYGPDDTIVCRSASGPMPGGWLPVLSHRLVPLATLRLLRRRHPGRVVWLPDSGLTYAVLVRFVLFHLVAPHAELRAVLLQRYRTPPRWLMAPFRGFVTAVASNQTDADAFTRMGLRTELLEPEVPPDRISDLDRTAARQRLGLPLDAVVYLHVGHATPGRNLSALAPLSREGLLVLVLSPHTPIDADALPAGPGVLVVHERVPMGWYYRAADVYVFPTVDPHSVIGMPMSIVEALGNGTPVVARRSAMTERWAVDERVVLVDSDEELVAAARSVVDRPERILVEAAVDTDALAVRGAVPIDDRAGGPRSGVLTAFASLLGAQAIGTGLGLLFWVVVARLVRPTEVGVAAAAISAQTLLGIVTTLGVGTMLIADLPLVDVGARKRLVRRGLGVVALAAVLAAVAFTLVAPHLGGNLHRALSSRTEMSVFVLGVAAASCALVIDQAGLGLRRARVQVGRNLLASSFRFPLAAGLLWFGPRRSLVLQICWVAPLAVSILSSWVRLRLPPSVGPRATLREDVSAHGGIAIRNHALSLALAAGSQQVPMVAALILGSADNAAFAIAWLLATVVFMPPYLLATALFAHGANASVTEFRATMRTTLPAALSLSAVLCVGAWTVGPLVLHVFGAHYADRSTVLLALMAPAGLWMVVKDHLIAFWRSQRRFATGLRLSLLALALEVAGAAAGGTLGDAPGLCLGWLAAIALEILLCLPWLRQTFGGLEWQSPLAAARSWRAARLEG